MADSGAGPKLNRRSADLGFGKVEVGYADKPSSASKGYSESKTSSAPKQRERSSSTKTVTSPAASKPAASKPAAKSSAPASKPAATTAKKATAKRRRPAAKSAAKPADKYAWPKSDTGKGKLPDVPQVSGEEPKGESKAAAIQRKASKPSGAETEKPDTRKLPRIQKKHGRLRRAVSAVGRAIGRGARYAVKGPKKRPAEKTA